MFVCFNYLFNLNFNLIIFSFVRINLEEKFERDMNDLSDGVSSSDESTSSSSMEVESIDKGKVT